MSLFSHFVAPANTWRVIVSQKEMQRIKLVASATEGRTSVAEAAELLGLSERQVKRPKRKYDPADAVRVHHGNQGRLIPAPCPPDACRVPKDPKN